MRFLVFLSILLFGAVAGAVETPVAPETARLAALGRLWGQVRYRHPHLAWQKIDWDRALLDAIPAVRKAADTASYRAAVATMLAALGDSGTRVYASEPLRAPTAGAALAVVGPDRVLVARLRAIRGDTDLTALTTAIAGTRAVVLDLRVNSRFETEHVQEALAEVQSLLTTRAAPGVPRRHLQHMVYSDDFANASLVTEFGLAVPAPKKPNARRVVLLANSTDTVTAQLLALLADGQAQLIVDGEPCGVPLAGVTIALGEGLSACVGIEEIADGRSIAVVRVAGAKVGDPALDRALALVRAAAAKPRAASPLPIGGFPPERGYGENKSPAVEYRLLALFRFWNIVRWFDPHIGLLDQPWESQLEAFIPKLIAAASPRDYELALAELAVRTDDSHAFINGEHIWDFKGNAAPPLRTNLVEGQLAITACLDAAVCTKVGVQPGDVVVSIDGTPAGVRFQALRSYEAGANAERRDYLAGVHLLWGAKASTARLELRDGSGRIKSVDFLRSAAYCISGEPHSGDVYRVLADNVGYLDLTRLQLEDIEPALGKIRDTAVTILDMRGYPHGRIWDLVGRFNTRAARYGVMMRLPTLGIVMQDEQAPLEMSKLEFPQPIPPSQGALYRGKTIMLVHSDTLSQAEHLAMHFEAASGTVFIGSRTAGADGLMIRFRLPGGLLGAVTGEEVRHADGRPMQRVGIVPAIEVHPTLAGLRAGRDEVLERALQHAATLQQMKPK